MDDELRRLLRLAVARCRQELERDFLRQLEGDFGITADGRTADEAQLRHLDARGRDDRRAIVAALEHLRAAGFSPSGAVEQFVRESAFSTLNRLTALKLMEAPQRRLIAETIGKGTGSSGARQFALLSPEAIRAEPDGGYRLYLELLCEDLALEIGVLFDLRLGQGRLFPGEQALRAVLDELNEPALATAWAEDETLGWVYQYFTPKEQRDAARKASAAPRNAYELAFRNQFYTPRYVVAFLVDNTLGRLWYEMRHGNTRLAEQCRSLVRGVDEVFLQSFERWYSERETVVDRAFVLGERADIAPFALPGVVPREGEVLAPGACNAGWSGSGDDVLRLRSFAQFNRPFNWSDDPRLNDWLQQFDELATGAPDDPVEGRTQELWDMIYALAQASHGREGAFEHHALAVTRIANEIRRRLLAGRDPNASAEERLRAPMIVRHRPKRDPRELRLLDPGCGSGHFLLYAFDLLLTIYDEAWDDPELGQAIQREFRGDRAAWQRETPRLILRHNLHGIDIDLRAVQIAQLALWLRAQRAWAAQGIRVAERPPVEQVHIVCAEPPPGEFDLPEEFLASLENPLLQELMRHVWATLRGLGGIGAILKLPASLTQCLQRLEDAYRKGALWQQLSLFTYSPPPTHDLRQLERFGRDPEFWAQADSILRRDIERYLAQGGLVEYPSRTLIGQEAQRALQVVSLLNSSYGVVLMNPPFGSESVPAKSYVANHYPRTKNDLYAVFVELGLDLLEPGGRLGAITSRTGFFLTSFRTWREEILLKEAQPIVVADLGYGVLDTAMVETAA